MKMKVYYNLHNKLWSLKDTATGLVIGHAKAVEVNHCDFQVSEAGRLRVLSEGRKNVHAFVVGHVRSVVGFIPYKGRGVEVMETLYHKLPTYIYPTVPVRYNPKVAPWFHLTGSPELRFTRADAVLMTAERTLEAINPE